MLTWTKLRQALRLKRACKDPEKWLSPMLGVTFSREKINKNVPPSRKRLFSVVFEPFREFNVQCTGTEYTYQRRLRWKLFSSYTHMTVGTNSWSVPNKKWPTRGRGRDIFCCVRRRSRSATPSGCAWAPPQHPPPPPAGQGLCNVYPDHVESTTFCRIFNH